MDVELLVVPDCPNEATARDLLRDAARQAGITDLRLTVTVIDTDEHARLRGFIGSPTFLVDGVDPFAVTGAAVGVSCRIYRSGDGASGVPDLTALRAALVRACVSRANAEGGQ